MAPVSLGGAAVEVAIACRLAGTTAVHVAAHRTTVGLAQMEWAVKLTQPEEVAARTQRLMEGFTAPWCVAGGWALDLFLGRRTRLHSDVELSVLRRDQARLHAQFDGWAFAISVPDAQGGHRRQEWRKGEHLELPVHEIHVHSLTEPPQSIEILLSESVGDRWVFRRDATIVMPLEHAFIHTEFGVRVLSPEIALLFKAKSPRRKDEEDFRAIAGVLDASRKHWLEAALRRTHPTHSWLQVLRQT